MCRNGAESHYSRVGSEAKSVYIIIMKGLYLPKRFIKIKLDFLYTEWYTKYMDNKENIIKKATEIFAKLGYEGAGIQQIVDASRYY